MNDRRSRLRAQHRAIERAKYDADYFREDYWKEDLPGQVGNRGLSYNDPDHTARFRFLALLLKSHFDVASLVDVGCGTGGLLSALADIRAPAWGCDGSFEAIRRCSNRERSSAFVAGVEAIPLRDRAFDIVTCFDVLEHVPILDLEDATRELVRISNRWIVATINLDNPYRFHPTVLSRESWETLFLLVEDVVLRKDVQNALRAAVESVHPEYDFFVVERKAV
jgi:2-polyprenyl-3-methyl-5-hydroxy-6-metoxy-1,4-benzoquinol methylase